MTDKKELTNEDSDSRAQRSNEYSFHGAAPVAAKKIRLKNKVTGATVGIFSDHKADSIAHAEHPLKHKLFVESIYADKLALVKDLMDLQESEKFHNVATSQKAIKQAQSALDANPDMWPGPKAGFKRQISIHTKHIKNAQSPKNESTISFGDYREVFEEQSALIESQLIEARAALAENAFGWKKTPSSIKWKDDDDKPVVKKVEPKVKVDPNAPKRPRGRPPGQYGSYKVGDRSAGDKAAIGAKVHANPDRKAKYDDAIAARKEFKSLMNNAIKKKQEA
jgi:hypothetical protein